MRIIIVFIICSSLVVFGWWLKHEGPGRWPNAHSLSIETIAPTNTTTNETTVTNASVNTNSTPSVLLSSPANVTTSVTGTDVTVSWDAVVGAHGYAITRNDTFIGVVYGTQFIDFVLLPSTTYVYTVTTVNSLNVAASDPISVSATTPTQVATTPTPTPTKPTTPTKNTNTKTSTPNKNTAKPTANTPTNSNPSSPTTHTPSTPTNTSTPPANTNTAPPPTPTPTPTPTPPACGQGGSCTTADVAAHSTRSNCWVYLSPLNKVYNVTAYVSKPSQHPGGDVIVPYCGKNMYSAFIGSAGGHSHSSKALNTTLQAYYIGPFAP